MKLLRLKDLPDRKDGHFLDGLVKGRFLNRGGLGFKAPGFRTHSHDGPGGEDRHIHDDLEVFIILQGRAVMEIDGVQHPLTTGDICIVESGEDHHLIADLNDPCVNLWLHAGPRPHPEMESTHADKVPARDA